MTENFQVKLTIKTAKLPENGLKTEYACEFIVDGGSARKSEFSKKSKTPKWDETFAVLLTPTSKLDFNIYKRGKADRVMSGKLDIQPIVDKYNGTLRKVPVTIKLSNGPMKGELEAELDGILLRHNNQLTAPVVAAAQAPRESNSPQGARSRSSEERLPPGWEVRYTPDRRKYYVNHNNKTTSWTLPTVNGVTSPSVANVAGTGPQNSPSRNPTATAAGVPPAAANPAPAATPQAAPVPPTGMQSISFFFYPYSF